MNNLLKPGDIVLYSGKKPLDRLIQWVTRSKWNHVSLVVGKLVTGQYVVMEAAFPGVRLWTLMPIDVFDESKAVYRATDDSNLQLKVVEYAICMNQMPYDIFIVWKIIWRHGIRASLRILKSLEVPHIIDGEVVCSEFVQEVYSKAGLKLLPDDRLLLPGDIPKLETVWSIA